jgi:hypothetical protein
MEEAHQMKQPAINWSELCLSWLTTEGATRFIMMLMMEQCYQQQPAEASPRQVAPRQPQVPGAG